MQSMDKAESDVLMKRMRELVENAPFILILLDDPRCTEPGPLQCHLITNVDVPNAKSIMVGLASTLPT